MTLLLYLLCTLLALAIFAGAYYFADKIISLKHRVNLLEDSYAAATKHIAEQEQHIIGLTQELEFTLRDKEQTAPRQQRTGWNPSNPMNITDRHERQ